MWKAWRFAKLRLNLGKKEEHIDLNIVRRDFFSLLDALNQSIH